MTKNLASAVMVAVALLGCGTGAAQEEAMPKKTLAVGDKAPDFSAPSVEGEVSLSSLKGKVVVLYFYPKDDTPGCTAEACAFRDAKAEMQKAGAVVLGVSKDSLDSHARFAEKKGLNFPLLSDPEGKLITLYGAWKEKSMFGKTAMGIERSTFLIDREGIVRKIWRPVRVEGHDREVLECIKSLG